MVATTTTPDRTALVRRGQRLEYFTVAWNSLEALVSICAGLVAGSVSLVGFGLDSVIEVGSGAALLWRLHHDSFAGPPTKLLSARYHRDRLFCCLDPIHQNFDCR